MRDLALTSLIFKNGLAPLIGGLLLFSFGCSSEKIAPKIFSKKIPKKSERITNYGPTVPNAVFHDKTKEYGLTGIHGVSFNAVDLNGDGRTDLVVLPNFYNRPHFYLFSAKENKFIEWDHDPLPLDFKASFLVFNDLNKDGVVDLISGVLNQKSEMTQVPLKVYYGKTVEGKLQFTDSGLNLPSEPTSSVTIVDYNLDGWPDIFVSNWFDNMGAETKMVPDRLLENQKGVFKDVSHLLLKETVKSADQLFPPEARPTFGSSSCDIDQNGFPDILTVSSGGYRNKLWMNILDKTNGNRYFEDVGVESNYAADHNGSLIPTGGGRSFFSACADYNSDGLMDIFLGELSHAYDNSSVDKSSVLTGSRDTYPPYFIRTEYLSDAHNDYWNQGDRRAVWFDYNLDGRIDLLVDNSGFPPHSKLVFFEQEETKAFANVAGQLGIDIVNPMSSIVLDLNNDGKLDIITSQNNIRRSEIPARLYVFENHVKTTGRAWRFHLQGIRANTDALGAMVMLYTRRDGENIVQRRWVEYSQGGLPSQNEKGVHFGVDAKTEVLGVKVRWPYVKTKGFQVGEVVEKLYPLEKFKKHNSPIELTLCENGGVFLGKMKCPTSAF